VVVAGACGLVFLLAGQYVLPWYSAWVLPLLALAWRSRVAGLAAVQAGVIWLVYGAPPLLGPGPVTTAQTLPACLAAAALAYVVWSGWHDRLALPIGRRSASHHAPVPVARSG
jgi:hypothetical protein